MNIYANCSITDNTQVCQGQDRYLKGVLTTAMKNIKVVTWLKRRDSTTDGSDDEDIGFWIRWKIYGMIRDLLIIQHPEELGVPITLVDHDEERGAIGVQKGDDICRETIKIGHIFHNRLRVGESD